MQGLLSLRTKNIFFKKYKRVLYNPAYPAFVIILFDMIITVLNFVQSIPHFQSAGRVGMVTIPLLNKNFEIKI